MQRMEADAAEGLGQLLTGQVQPESGLHVLSFLSGQELNALSRVSKGAKAMAAKGRDSLRIRMLRQLLPQLLGAAFGPSAERMTPPEWEVRAHETYGKQLRLREGQSARDALLDFIRNPAKHSVDCAEFVQVANICANFLARAPKKTAYGEQNFFLRQHGSSSLRSQATFFRKSKDALMDEYDESNAVTRRGLDHRTVLRDAPIGSRVSFYNPPGTGTPFGNENAIKIGPDRYAAHPFGTNLREEEIIERLGLCNLSIWRRPYFSDLVEEFNYKEPSEEEKKKKDQIYIRQIEYYVFEPPLPSVEVLTLPGIVVLPLPVPPSSSAPAIASRRPAEPSADPRGDERCFITTACTELMGLPNDCFELATLRGFRDEYLFHRAGGRALIAEYYRIAPEIVQRIVERQDSATILASLYEWVRDCVILILVEQKEAALRRYTEMVFGLSTFLGIPVAGPQLAATARIKDLK